MHLTLRQLQIFTAVAATGSTAAAGLQIALSQSATSAALNELENFLDAQLFDRIGKRLVLNDTGRALLPQARALLDSAADIEAQFGIGSAAGGARHQHPHAHLATRLRVGASTTIGNYLLPALVASHLRATPGAAIDATIGNTGDIVGAVVRLEVDVGLIEGPCHEHEVRAWPWLEDELVIVCAPTHALMQQDSSGARVGVVALRRQRWLVREPGSGTRETVEHALLPHLHQWDCPMQLGSTEAIKQAAAQGLGLACLSLSAVQDLLTLQRLRVLSTTLPRLTRRFYLIHHRQKQISPSLQRFIAHCEAARIEDFS